MITVYPRSHSIHHDVFSNGFELIVRTVFQVQKGVQTHFLALENVRGPESLPLLVARSFLRIGEASHGDSHEVHVVLVLGELCYVESMPEHELRIHVLKAVVPVTLTTLPEPVPHLVAVLLQLCGIDAFCQQIRQLSLLLHFLLDLGLCLLLIVI